jgi:hypothetical protein
MTPEEKITEIIKLCNDKIYQCDAHYRKYQNPYSDLYGELYEKAKFAKAILKILGEKK